MRAFYHETSQYFLDRITEHGFVVQYRLVNDEEVAVLRGTRTECKTWGYPGVEPRRC